MASTLPPGAADPAQTALLNVALVSDAVAQADEVAHAAAPDTIVIVYQSGTATTKTLVDLLGSVSVAHGGARIGHLELVAHGSSGQIAVGNGNSLTSSTIPENAADLRRLNSLLAAGARFDLGVCSVAAGPSGKAFVDELSALTGAAVFASDDPVGSVPGADFVWEYNSSNTAVTTELFSVDELANIPSLCLADGAQLVSKTVADGTQKTAGSTFTQTWTIKNTGTSTWSTGLYGYTLNYVSGTQMGGSSVVQLSNAVAPGGQATFTVSLTAPSTAGTYTGTWRMSSSAPGYPVFGDLATVQIVVPQLQPPSTQYDRTAAVNYARKYAHSVSSDGYFWVDPYTQTYVGAGQPVPTGSGVSGGIGVDCAHYVSSCIGNEPHEPGGGLPVPSRTASYGEPGAVNLANWLVNSGYAVQKSSVDDLAPGDVIFYELPTNNHIAFYLGNEKIAAHSKSYLDVAWNTYSYSQVRFLHILASPQATTDNATLLSKSLADGTQVQPGAAFTQTWTMKNTGTSMWSTGTYGYTLNFGSGSQLGTTSYVTLNNPVAPGGQASFSATLKAPTTPGTYTGTWQMHNASTSSNPTGMAFGSLATVQIVVAGTSQIVRHGVDYSFSRPNPDALKAAGYDFAVRYVSNVGNTKNITSSEARSLQNAGIDIVLVFESGDQRMQSGYNAGVADANTAATVALSAGAPANFFCYFACDFDASASDQAAINAYLDGVKSVFGTVDRVGFYGGYFPMQRVLDAGKAAKGWQTAAWSGGNRDPRISMFQYAGEVSIAGGMCDVNDGFGNDLGQWSGSTSTAPTAPVLSNDSITWDASAPAGPVAALHWTAPTGMSGPLYDLYRNGVLIAANLNQTSFSDKAGLALGQSHTYWVKAHNSTVTIPSNTITVSIPANLGTAVPSVPVGLTASATSANSVHLGWTAASDPGVTWSVYRSSSSSGPWTLLRSNVATPSFDDVYSVPPSSTIYYAIKATNAGGTSEFCLPVSAMTSALSRPTAPTIVSAIAQGDNQISVSWTGILSAGQYVLQRATMPSGLFNTIRAFDPNVFSYVDVLVNPIAAATTYAYRLIGKSNGIESNPSNVVQATLSIPVSSTPVSTSSLPTLAPTPYDDVAKVYKFNGSTWVSLQSIDWSLPTIMLTHGWDDRFVPNNNGVVASSHFIQEFATEFANGHSLANYNVLAVNWNDDASGAPNRGSNPNNSNIGNLLNPIGDIFSDGFGDAIQSANNGIAAAKPLANRLLKLGMQPEMVVGIGHSNGAGFMASFAEESYKEVVKLYGASLAPKIRQLVALDAPVYTPSYARVLGAANSVGHIDNYYVPSIQSAQDDLWRPRVFTFGFGAAMFGAANVTNFEMNAEMDGLVSHSAVPHRYARTASAAGWGFNASDFMTQNRSPYNGQPMWQENYGTGVFVPISPLASAISVFENGIGIGVNYVGATVAEGLGGVAEDAVMMYGIAKDGAIFVGNTITNAAVQTYRFGVNSAVTIANETIKAADVVQKAVTRTAHSLADMAVDGANYVASGLNSAVQKTADKLSSWWPFSANSPTYVSLAVNVPADAEYLSFDLTVTNSGNDDQLLVGLGGDVIGQVDLASMQQSGTRAVQFAIGQYAGATNKTLTFYMPSDVSSNAQFVVGNVRVGTVTVDTAPRVLDITKNLANGAAVTFALSDFAAKFVDPDNDPLQKVKITSLPQHGILMFANAAVLQNQEIPAASLGGLTYAPAPNYVGSDSFGWNGSDGSLYAATSAVVNAIVPNWRLQVGGFSLNGFGADASAAALNVATFGNHSSADVSVVAKGVNVPNDASSRHIGLLARYGGDGESNTYLGALGATSTGVQAMIWRNLGGVWTLLASRPVLVTMPVDLRFDVQGNSLEFFVSDVLTATALDNSLTSGLAGLRSSAAMHVDEFSVSAIAPALPFSDSFNATAATLDVNSWRTQVGGFSQDGSAVVASTASLNVATYAHASAADVSVLAQGVDVVHGAGSRYVGLVARHGGAGDSNMYLGALGATGSDIQAMLWRNVGGVWTLLAQKAVTVAATVDLRFDVQGGTLTLFVAGVLEVSAFDTMLTRGFAGLRTSAGMRIDGFSASAPTPVLPFSDTFNTSAAALDADNWQPQVGGFRQDGASAVASANPLNLATYGKADVSDVSVVAQGVDVFSGSSFWHAGLIARYGGAGDNNMYLATLGNTGSSIDAMIWRNVGGVWTLLAQKAVTVAATVDLRFEVQGNSLKFYVAGVLKVTAFDTMLPHGFAGVRSSAGMRIDGFSASALAPVLPFSDTFNASAAALDVDNWQAHVGGFSRNGASAVGSANPLNLATYGKADVSDVSVVAQGVDVVSGSGSSHAGLIARYGGAGDSNMYLGALGNTGSGIDAMIWRNVGGDWTLLAKQPITVTTAVDLRFAVQGSSLKFYVAGVLEVTAFDTMLTHGFVGARTSAGTQVGGFSASALAPVLPFSDTFNTSAAALDVDNWQAQVGGFSRNGASAVGSANPLNLATYVRSDVSDVSVVAQGVDVFSGSGFWHAGLIARYGGGGDNNMYLATLGNTGSSIDAMIWRNVGGVWTLLARQSVVVTAAVDLRFDVQGGLLKFYVAGVLTLTAFDSMLPHGFVGVRSSAGMRIDGFSVSAIAPPFSDTFNTTAATLDVNNWQTPVGGFRQDGTSAVASANPLNLATYGKADASDVNVVAQGVDVFSGSGSWHAGLIARYGGAGDSNMYLATLGNTGSGIDAMIWRNVGGVWTLLAKQAVKVTTAVDLRFEVQGSTLKFYVAGVLKVTAFDTMLTHGFAGMRTSAGMRIDGFEMV